MNGNYFRFLALSFLIFACSVSEEKKEHAGPDDYYIFVGTYTSGESEGIYVYRMDMETGKLIYVGKATGIPNPSFLTLSNDNNYLYAVSETENFEGETGGSVWAYSIDPETASLNYLNKQPTFGAAPCHVSIDHSGRWLLTANYLGGNVTVNPINEDGTIGSATETKEHEGSSVHSRQKAPHAHCILPDPGNKFIFAADLGIDKLVGYSFNSEQGKLLKDDDATTTIESGAGPRHFKFHPNGRLLFLIRELDSSISSFSYNPETGKMTEVQTVPTLPEDFSGENTCADIHLHPNGRFVYGSNRGHNSIVVHRVDPETGEMDYVGHVGSGGKRPRNFGIDPTGRYMLVANQDSDNIVTFQINPETGLPEETGNIIEVPTPVCILFMAIR